MSKPKIEITSDIIKETIGKTGYIFENEVITKCETDDWNIITNRYYIDSITNKPREFDLIIYKKSKHNNIIYTTLVFVSCKKSEDKEWIFLKRRKKNKELVVDIHNNVTYTTNGQLNAVNISEHINKFIDNDKLLQLDQSTVVYGKQEIDGTEKKTNDTSIYVSIDSLIKSMNFELNRIKNQKSSNKLYTFFLVTAFKGKMKIYNVDESSLTDADLVCYNENYTDLHSSISSTVYFATDNKIESLIKEFSFVHNSIPGIIDSSKQNISENIFTNEKLINYIRSVEIDGIYNIVSTEFAKQTPEETNGVWLIPDRDRNILLLKIDNDGYNQIWDEQANLNMIKSYVEKLLFDKYGISVIVEIQKFESQNDA